MYKIILMNLKSQAEVLYSLALITIIILLQNYSYVNYGIVIIKEMGGYYEKSFGDR